LAAGAEDAGITGLWACDHLFWHRPLLEPMTSLAVAATATTKAVLGTCVLQLPMRSPAAVAREAGTLQMLSGGRFVLGLGVGSHSGEYDAAGVDFARRGEVLDQGIDALRSAWASAGDVDLRYRLDPPVPTIPIWIAGASEAALRRTARSGDGWVPMFISPDQYRSTRGRLIDLMGQAGRDRKGIASAIVTLVCVGDSAEVARKDGTLWLSDLYALPPKAFERHLIAGPPEECASGIAAYHDAGAEHVVMLVAADDPLRHVGAVVDALGNGSSASSPGSPDPTSAINLSHLEHLGAAP